MSTQKGKKRLGVGKWSPIGNSDIASMLARRLRGHVPLRAASPQHGCACVCLGFSFAGSCAAAGCKPTARLRLRVLGFFVCGVMCRCGLQARNTAGKQTHLVPQNGQGTAACPLCPQCPSFRRRQAVTGAYLRSMRKLRTAMGKQYAAPSRGARGCVGG